MSTTTSSKEKEEILVLYGSQTGNSEQAAIELSSQIPSRLGSQYSSRHMQLDDFLEVEDARWTRLVVIITSSYGVGQAPMGCYRFRAFCDTILEDSETTATATTTTTHESLLSGVTFAMLGLGDSNYTTYFNNPTALNKAMLAAGAVRVGDLGKADASGRGEDSQDKVIQRWMDGIWTHLEASVNEKQEGRTTLERLEEIQMETLKIATPLLSSSLSSGKEKDSNSSSIANGRDRMLQLILVALIVALLAVVTGMVSK